MDSWKLALIGLGVFFVLSVNIIVVYFLCYYRKKRRSSTTAIEADIQTSKAHSNNQHTNISITTPLDENIDLEKQTAPKRRSKKPQQKKVKNNSANKIETTQEQQASSPATSAPNTPTPSMKIQYQKELYGGSQQQQHLQHNQILLQHHHGNYHQLSTSLSPPRASSKPTITTANKTQAMVSSASSVINSPLQKLRVFSLSPDNTNIPETIVVASPNHNTNNEKGLVEEDYSVTDRQNSYNDDRQSRALSSTSPHRLDQFIANNAASPPPNLLIPDDVLEALDWRGPTPPWTQYTTPQPHLSTASRHQ
ncbi:hypothetical protein BDF20DRAFT_909019 [Mycotypha africana]|uniref:uncharacterized protein n=1 Tax=Mycotypha africana TaxID=64632 RepID=UPI002301AA98|nr:uncharacterized protein BDF20DRAFT_909019 [Mycotypha africana]KAI8991204.1 hypothetical protein BDF20DRAFT_909019 [Mycotypha africana]